MRSTFRPALVMLLLAAGSTHAASQTAWMAGLGITRVGESTVDLDLQNAPLEATLQALANVGHLNLVMAQGIQGRVTLRLRNVPWKTALQAVLRASGLDMELTGNVLFVDRAVTLREARAAQSQRCPAADSMESGSFCFNK